MQFTNFMKWCPYYHKLHDAEHSIDRTDPIVQRDHIDTRIASIQHLVPPKFETHSLSVIRTHFLQVYIYFIQTHSTCIYLYTYTQNMHIHIKIKMHTHNTKVRTHLTLSSLFRLPSNPVLALPLLAPPIKPTPPSDLYSML